MFAERRQSPRARFNRAGHIHHDLTGLRRCTIVDLSNGGARLCADDDLPPEFTLSIRSDDGERRKACRVVWRRGQRLGVVFIAQ